MGLCFSKKQQEKPPGPPPCVSETSAKTKKPSKIAVVVADEKATRTPQPKRAAKAEEPAAADKKAVFVVKTKAAASGEEKKEEARPVLVTTVPVRTSSCTKEEVDAIAIQCGRLSRSSPGRTASSETGGGHRRHSGSKRSYDFDQERRAGGGGGDEECDWERQGVPVSRSSPHRSSPQRKRSGSRERSGGGSRRSSRSPGRRAEGVSSAATASFGGGVERARQQPGKMVSVPAREKGRAPSPAAASGKRCASPRSSSPARVAAAAAGNENTGGGQTTAGQTPSLSRSSSRKAEQSPYRRSPMAEIDENSLRNHNAKPQKKSTENSVATVPQKATERAKEQTQAAVSWATERAKEQTQAAVSCRSGKDQPEIAEETTIAASETRAPSSKTTATRTVNIVSESLKPRSGCRSRRASRDFDQNPNSYATQLLEDIQNYHHHQLNTSAAATAATLPSFSLPACVSKACSILEAVADLNSTSSENRACEPGRSANDKGSVNEPLGSDDLAELSVHKYVSVRGIRGETEPQESAGSNSVSGHPWTPSREPNSVESTDRTWSASRSNNADEVVEQGSHGARSPLNYRPRQSKQRPSGRSRGAGSGGNNVHRGRSAHRGSGSVASGRSGVRAVSASS